MAGRRWAEWTSAERQVFARYVRGLLDGRLLTVSKAAEACRIELAELRRRTPAADRPAFVRNWPGICSRLRKATGRGRSLSANSFWSEAELAVADRHARLLRTGRHASVPLAAAACLKDVERLYHAGKAGRPIIPRSRGAVVAAVAHRARLAGWLPIRTRWSQAEEVALKRHVNALMRGEYHDAREAADACRRDICRSKGGQGRRQTNRTVRPLSAVYRRLSARALSLGWSLDSVRWRPEERRTLERHARRLAQNDGPELRQVARDCRRELGRLGARFRAGEPHDRRRAARWTYNTIETYLGRLSLAQGRAVVGEWRADELEVVGRYAQALVDGRFASAPSAAPACVEELAELRQSWRANDPVRFGRTQPRTAVATYKQIRQQANTLQRRWPQSGWTAEEMAACRRWVRWYDRHRGAHRLSPWSQVGPGLQEELAQMGSRRSATACAAKFWRVWREQRGAA